jgi:hypothetical protein
LWDAAELDIWICFLSVSVLHFVVGCVGVFWDQNWRKYLYRSQSYDFWIYS